MGTIQDNELAFYRSLGLTGTLMDMRKKYYNSNAVGMLIDSTLGKPVGLTGPTGGYYPGIVILGQQNTAVVAPADTNKNTLYSLTIPAGLMGPNDSLRINAGCSCTNNTNTKTWQVEIGGSVVTFQGIQSTAADSIGIVLANRNSLSSQHMRNCGHAIATGANGTFSFNFAQAQTLTVSATKTVAGDTVTLESVLVELIRAV